MYTKEKSVSFYILYQIVFFFEAFVFHQIGVVLESHITILKNYIINVG